MTVAEVRDLDVRIDFMEGLVRRDPGYVDALQLLGDHYTQRGRYTEGLVVDEQLSRLELINLLVFYNLVCSYFLMDWFEYVIDVLEKVLYFGYSDFKWLVKDLDFCKLRKHPLYQRVAERIREMKSKVR